MKRKNARAASKRPVIDLDAYIPAYLTQVGNKWARSSSHLYMRRFGIGINEFRVMVMVAIEPGINASRMCAIVGMDKAAIGRSIQSLEEKGILRVVPDAKDGRSRCVTLTDKGWEVHEEMRDLALAREKLLVSGFSPAEVLALISLLDRLRKNLAKVRAADLEAAKATRRLSS
jgi:DNA-binding MarR family transcriptional regulator